MRNVLLYSWINPLSNVFYAQFYGYFEQNTLRGLLVLLTVSKKTKINNNNIYFS
jgi:hypothetical protein